MDTSGALGLLFLIVLISIVVFLICREVLCWYWKINEQLSCLMGIRETLEEIQQQLARTPGVGTAPAGDQATVATPVVRLACKRCERPVEHGARFCEYCGAPQA